MLPFHVWDVFTDRPFSGNPLAIVGDADGLSAAQMQIIARQFNLSETIFVMSPRDPGHDARVRIFLPGAEIPFAGHPTIGCALHLSDGRDGAVMLEEEAGTVPVTIRDGMAEFVAPVLPTRRDGCPEAADLARALDLPAGAIGFGRHRPGIFEAGTAFLFVPLADAEALSAARPSEPSWTRTLDAAGVDKVYLYTEGAGSDYEARMFAPGLGVPEDPATGAASAILAGQLLAWGALRDGSNRFALRQGARMGRSSRIGLTVIVTGGAIAEVRVSGRAVKVAEGRIRIPEVA